MSEEIISPEERIRMKDLVTLTRLNTFFEQFAVALELYDTKAMSHFYLMPCTLLSDDSMQVFNEPSRLEGFFNRGASVYKQIGVAQVAAEIRNRQLWTDKTMLVKVRWKYAGQNGQPIYDCDYHYIMKLEKNDQLKIIMSVSLNEKERVETWMKTNKRTGI